MAVTTILESLIGGAHLTEAQARELMQALMRGDVTEAQVGGALVALRMKGYAAEELATFALVLREHAVQLAHPFPEAVDTCGTGGGSPTFNLSTGAAFVAAAAGVKVAKHGNRGVTSGCGSADVLEAMGARLDLTPERLTRILEETNIVFLFAPSHHPAMKNVGPARKALGVRTVFNFLGPLTNPAGARRQLIGVYDSTMLRPMAEALRILGAERALVVHGVDGLDEISPCAATRYALLADGDVSEGEWAPQDFGIQPMDPALIRPSATVVENAEMLRAALASPAASHSHAVVPNAAAAMWLSRPELSLTECAERAMGVMAEGLALKKLDDFVQATRSQ
jgi:anthranilate phosphoribosyltransferase